MAKASTIHSTKWNMTVIDFSRIGLSEVQLLGHLEFMWMGAHASGNYFFESKDEIEAACRWKGEAHQLADILINRRWIDEVSDNSDVKFSIHDFDDHKPSYVKTKERVRRFREKDNKQECNVTERIMKRIEPLHVTLCNDPPDLTSPLLTSPLINILHGASKNEASVPEQTKPQKPEDTTPVLVEFECNGDVKTYRFTEKKLAEYQDLFPSLDILQEVKRAKQWIVDNSSRRKTARGMPRFLNSWLGRANDRFRPTANSPNGTPSAPAVSWKAQNEADRLAEEQRVAKSLIEDMRRNEERLAQYRQP